MQTHGAISAPILSLHTSHADPPRAVPAKTSLPNSLPSGRWHFGVSQNGDSLQEGLNRVETLYRLATEVAGIYVPMFYDCTPGFGGAVFPIREGVPAIPLPSSSRHPHLTTVPTRTRM